MSEAANTLKNTSYAKIIECLGTGEWEEVAIGGLKGLYLNNVVVESQSGATNIQGVTLDTRPGSKTQTKLSIADESEVTYSVGSELKYNVPIEKVVSGDSIDLLKVTLSFPTLTEVNVNTGYVGGSKVQHKISWKNSTDSTWRVVPSQDKNWYWDSLSTDLSSTYTNYYSYVITVTFNTGAYFDGESGTKRNIPLTYKIEAQKNGGDWVTISSAQVGDLSSITATLSSVNTDTVKFRVSKEDMIFVNGADPSSFSINSVKGHTFSIVSGAGNGVQTVEGKCTSTYQKQYTFAVTGTGPYTVMVTRLTEDSTSSYIVNASSWALVSAVTQEKFNYPGFVMSGVYIDASQYNSIPSRGYLCKMSRIKVPTNYGPIRRSYTGLWDGTFKTAWSDNPAWVFYDVLTNKHQGLGMRLPENCVDKGELYQIAKYCDELVKTENGSWEPRFTCNVYLQTKQEAYKFVSDMATVFRGITYWGLGTVIPVQDRPRDPVYAFTNANVIDGVFNYQGADYSTRYNAVYVTWNDPNNFYKQATEYVSDDTAIADMGYLNTTSITAFGCISRSQARRVGKWALYTNTYEGEVVSFSTAIEGTIPRPGDVIKVCDSLKSSERRGGRILSYEGSPGNYFLELDKSISLLANTHYSVSTINENGEVQESTLLLSEDQETDAVTINNSVAPTDGSIYIITDNSAVPERLFRVVSVAEKDKMQYAISAVLYDPDKYDYIEKEEAISSRTLPSQVIPDSVTNIVATYANYTTNGSLQNKARFEWSAPKYANSYIVTIISPDGQSYSSEQKENYYEILGAPEGAYTVSVTPKSAFGITGAVYSQTMNVSMSINAPTGLTLVNAISPQGQSFNDVNAYFSWNSVPNATKYQIRVYDENIVLKNTYEAYSNAFTYTLVNYTTDGMTNRVFYLSISALNGDVSSNWTTPKTFTNPPPSIASAPQISKSGDSYIIAVSSSTVSDYAGAMIMYSLTDPNFIPEESGTLLYDGSSTTAIVPVPSQTMYCKATWYDSYGKTNLFWSETFTLTP